MKPRVAALAGAAVQVDGVPSMLDPQGRGAADIAGLWWTMFAILGAVFLAVLAYGALALFRRHRSEEPLFPSGRPAIVVGGIAAPLAVALVLTILTVRLAADAGISGGGHGHGEEARRHAEIEVIGHQFWWEVRYPDAGVVTANEIHIPAGRPILLALRAADVIHAPWVPQLHGKVDMTPGHETYLELEADRPGTYRGQCAEFCGVQHALMALLVIAETPADYEAWLARESAPAEEPAGASAQEGAQVFLDAGCGACHTVGGTEADGVIGPDLTHFASRRTIGAVTVENNRGNLGGWIVDSQTIKPGNLMPPMRVESEDLQRLLDYLETLE